MEALFFKIHLLSTLYMFGLIWFVQVVHYPLFAKVLPANFVAYEQRHTYLTGFVAALPMIIELGSALLLLFFYLESTFYWLNAIGVLLLWASTFLVQVPLHNALSKAHNSKAIRKLVRSNWIRTVLWSIRAIALVAVIPVDV